MKKKNLSWIADESVIIKLMSLKKKPREDWAVRWKQLNMIVLLHVWVHGVKKKKKTQVRN